MSNKSIGLFSCQTFNETKLHVWGFVQPGVLLIVIGRVEQTT